MPHVQHTCLLSYTEYYDLDILSSKVVVFNTTHRRVTFTINIQEVRILEQYVAHIKCIIVAERSYLS